MLDVLESVNSNECSKCQPYRKLELQYKCGKVQYCFKLLFMLWNYEKTGKSHYLYSRSQKCITKKKSKEY